MRWTLALFVWLACAVASAQSVVPQQEFPFVGRVLCDDGSIGTGTVIARNGTHSFIVTAQHVLRDAHTVYFQTTDNRKAVCLVAKADPVNDWAILRCPKLGIKPARSALFEDVTVSPGDSAGCFGYASGSQFSRSDGHVRQLVSADGYTFAVLETSCVSVGGMSGGPVVSRGCVVGVITGYSNGCGVGPYFPRVRQECRPVLPPTINPRAIPQPTIVSPPEPAPATDLTGVLAAIEELRLKIESLELTPGPQGQPGKDGATDPTGPQGPAGMPGKDATYDPSQLPPLRIQTLNPDGTVHQDVTARLGDLIRLKPVIVSGDK